MRAILISDLHLTDRPADAYRWKIFEQVRDIANTHGVSDLIILGDLTEFKDYHSSRLVNRIVDSFYALRKTSRIIDIHILKGNHDGLDADHPYFAFLNRIPWAHFYVRPTRLEVGKDTLLFLPHTRQPEEDWKELELGEASHIFFHGTVAGAKAETGKALDGGVALSWFEGLRGVKVYAGDVHVPQKVGAVTYVGAPYPIRFGDEFEPRALLLDEKKEQSLALENIRKRTITINAVTLGDEFDTLRAGDQVKVLIELHDSELGEFQQLKKEVAEHVAIAKADLRSVQLVHKVSPTAGGKPKLKSKAGGQRRSPEDEVLTFCAKNKVEDSLRDIGIELVKE